MAKTKGKLPNKPSALIRLAIADLTAAEKSKKYAINMWDWHIARGDFDEAVDGNHKKVLGTACAVCFAGSVMALTLKASPAKNKEPEEFDLATTSKLYALNCFRIGNIHEGFQEMGLDLPTQADDWKRVVNIPETVGIVDYESDPPQFKKDMRELAAKLERAGF